MPAQPLALDVMQCAAEARKAPAICFAMVRPDKGYDVRCYGASGEIRCCGHGLLATAYVLHCRQNGEHEAGAQPLRLYQPEASQPLQVKWEDGSVWLRLPRLQCRPAEVPDWAAKAVGVWPQKAAVAGGEEDYLILEIGADVSLAELDVQYSIFAQNSRRAVILSQRSACRNACKSYDFLLRYFAPQYGVDEDKVTGSANRVLADYWAQHTGESQFRALQCSAEGGVVKMHVEREHVWISGQLKFV